MPGVRIREVCEAVLLTFADTRTALSDGAESAAEALVAGYRLAFLVAALYFFRRAKKS